MLLKKNTEYKIRLAVKSFVDYCASRDSKDGFFFLLITSHSFFFFSSRHNVGKLFFQNYFQNYAAGEEEVLHNEGRVGVWKC
jgi:hypothetical protein